MSSLPVFPLRGKSLWRGSYGRGRALLSCRFMTGAPSIVSRNRQVLGRAMATHGPLYRLIDGRIPWLSWKTDGALRPFWSLLLTLTPSHSPSLRN